MSKRSMQGVKRAKTEERQDHPGRARAMASLGRQFDDLYEQMDLQLTRMAHIQLQFDALRSKIRHL